MYKNIGYIFLFLLPICEVVAQTVHGRVIDEITREGIPFTKLSLSSSNYTVISGPRGYFIINQLGQFTFNHPLYEPFTTKLENKDSVEISLKEKESITPSKDQLLKGVQIIKNYHTHLPETKTTKFAEFEFLTYSNFEIYEQSRENHEEWELLSSLETIEKNRFKYPDKKYARVVRSHFNDGDSISIGFIPINTYTITNDNEYLSALNMKYYHPLFKGAEKRYDYALVDSFSTVEGKVSVIYFKPKPKKKFIGLKGVLYFINDRSESWGGYIMPNREQKQDFTITYYLAQTSKGTRFLSEMDIVLHLKNIPNYTRNSLLYLTTKNSTPSFDVKNTSQTKWVDMALFNHEKDTTKDDTWMMRQIVDKEKLEYIEKDTTDREFVLSNTLKWMYNVYEGKLGYRTRFFDLNNEFAINHFESVRLGIGLQSHENLSDVFTFGGYFAYGIGDGKFKYGANVGAYFGNSRNNLFTVKITQDLLEPGRVNYMDKRKDLVRDFFTSRMDEYLSTEVSLRTRLNAYFTSSLIFNNYSLKPLYEYLYNPAGKEIEDTQTFKFTETSILFNIGTPLNENPNLRNILYRKKKVMSNLFLNMTKGWDLESGGDFNYWKFNSKITSSIRLTKQDELTVVLDGGIMTKNMPYQINYVGPGTEFKLTGLIINNAFQSMKLYGFFADRYIHSFMNYNFGNVIFKKSKFKPELALALNVGWGKITGNTEIHENIEVRDYASGYYETGVIFNNLLRLKIYNYFYGGLGVGVFYGFGPDDDDGAFAFRITYEIGVL